MTEPVAIIGSHSFSGNSYTAHRLRHGSCVTFSRSSSLKHEFDARTNSSKANTENHITWNLNEDSSQVIKLLQDNKISTIVNFAAQSMVGESWLHPEDWYQANLVSLSKFVNRVRSDTAVSKFIHFTTPEVYGSTQGWVTENFNFAPNTPYAVSRAAGDMHLKALYDNFNFPVIFTRAANVYGEYQPLYRIVPKAILFALTGRKLQLQGGGKSVRSFIHISDVNNALDKLIMEGIPGESYHISTQDEISIYELVKKIAEKLNVDLDKFVNVVADRPGKDFAYQLNSLKIRSELNWSDKVSLDEGLDRTISWVKKNLKELEKMPTDYIHRK